MQNFQKLLTRYFQLLNLTKIFRYFAFLCAVGIFDSADEFNFLAQISIEVVNQSVAGSKKHVGRTFKKLKPFFKALDKATSIQMELTHDPPSGKTIQKGYIQFIAVLSLDETSAADPSKKELPTEKVSEKKEEPQSQSKEGSKVPTSDLKDKEKAKEGTEKENKKEEEKSKKPEPSPRASSLMKDKTAQLSLNISAIEVHELANTGSMFDGQDPAVEIAINKQLFQTKR
jgi:hypothetical protein